MGMRAHAERLVARVDTTLATAIARSSEAGALALGLTVRPVDNLTAQRGARGWCDGISFLDAGILIYVRSPNSRRENFTIAHEIAHFLVDRDDDAVDWLADLPDSARGLEQLCDQVAGRLLVTDDILDQLVGTRPVKASDVVDLYNITNASEPACAIALTRRLRSPGAVALLERSSETVIYASLVWENADERPIAYPWPGQSIPAGHPLRNLAVGSHLQRGSWWSTPWGERQHYYLDAVGGHNRIAAVFAETDLWNCEALHIDPPSRRTSNPSFTMYCTCGFNGEVTSYPHDVCRNPFCPKCGACECDRKFANHRPCENCFVATPAHDLVNGLCSMCR